MLQKNTVKYTKIKIEKKKEIIKAPAKFSYRLWKQQNEYNKSIGRPSIKLEEY